ncbi:MAG: hypothetical protein IPK26_00195 [Planctomycetes bacterium]|nr:hypothetical protein [Planctomycetota bacterium]
MAEPNDLLQRPMTEEERELVAIYQRLKALARNPALPPCALMNARQAMVMLWNACNDLALVHEEPGCD